jgi:hypothetical protein
MTLAATVQLPFVPVPALPSATAKVAQQLYSPKHTGNWLVMQQKAACPKWTLFGETLAVLLGILIMTCKKPDACTYLAVHVLLWVCIILTIHHPGSKFPLCWCPLAGTSVGVLLVDDLASHWWKMTLTQCSLLPLVPVPHHFHELLQMQYRMSFPRNTGNGLIMQQKAMCYKWTLFGETLPVPLGILVTTNKNTTGHLYLIIYVFTVYFAIYYLVKFLFILG